jgi:hypothetical protein
MELKNFVDFAYSLVNMDETKNGKFILPKEIVFELDENNHQKIHKEIKEEKKDYLTTELNEDFEVDIFGVNFKFTKNVD